ncbi:MAG: HAD-IB family phosphatase [bacterium]|nr:MAG: HAD-IB family phosphatase [bacterium]
MEKWAVFDIDGTLFPPSSMEKRFILFMLKKGAIPLPNIAAYFFTGMLKTLSEGYEEGFKNNKYYLRHLPVITVSKTAANFVKNQVWPQISATGLQRISEYRAKNYKILLMSGSPDFLTFPLAKFIQPDFTIAAELETRHDRFTGNLANLHPYGKRKSQLLLNFQATYKINFKHSVVYANHQADFHHMSMFHTAVAINPSPKLKTLAERHHWKIEKWR